MFSATKAALCSEMKKEVQIDDILIEILTRSESVRYSGQLITFQQQETTESQESYQGSLGDVSQVQAGTDIEKLHAQTSSPTVRRSNNSRRYATPLEHGHPPKSMKE